MMGRALPLVLAGALGGCNAAQNATTAGVTLSLDIPNAALDPKGYTDVDVTLHTAAGDIVRSAKVNDNAFDLGELDPTTDVWVEAVLRTDTGTAVGYGRTPIGVDFSSGAAVVIPVRRPLLYLAGLYSVANQANGSDTTWTPTATTFGDLTTGNAIDGSARLTGKGVVMVSAGPSLYQIEQATTTTQGPTTDPATKLTGPATIKPVSTGDHAVGGALADTLMGGVRDGVGSDDGKWLIIGTTQYLYLVDTAAGKAQAVANGDFARVAMINNGDGTYSAIALANRGLPCNPNAQIYSVGFSGAGGEVQPSVLVATGGFADVASDGGRAFAVDACQGTLVEVKGTNVQVLRGSLVRPTALAVSNGRAYIGSEKTLPPIGLALVVASLTSNDPPTTLWSEASQQVASAVDYPGVQRQMGATTSAFMHLEVGAGGDYVAATTLASYTAPAEPDLTFPKLDLDTEELRVFDTSTGGVLQRYRSWCDGVITGTFTDVQNWACATTSGQTAPASSSQEHHLGSMTFLFGKK